MAIVSKHVRTISVGRPEYTGHTTKYDYHDSGKDEANFV